MSRKLVLVTGASSGIGKATAELFAARGAKVLLLARNRRALEETAGVIGKRGGSAATYPVDLARADAVEACATAISAEQGVPDVILNNAGVGRWLSLVETSPDAARQMIEVPYLAAFYVTHAFLPEMIARGSGQVAFITSPASFMAWPNAAAYIAARHALHGLIKALRTEMRGKNIGVTEVTLGTVASSYWEHNPGSREHLPRTNRFLLPELTVDQAATTIVDAIEARKRHIVRPWFFRVPITLGLNG